MACVLWPPRLFVHALHVHPPSRHDRLPRLPTISSATIAAAPSTGGRPVAADARGPVAEASKAATEHEAGPPTPNAIQMQSNGLRPNPREARWPTRKHARSAQCQNGYALSRSKISRDGAGGDYYYSSCLPALLFTPVRSQKNTCANEQLVSSASARFYSCRVMHKQPLSQ